MKPVDMMRLSVFNGAGRAVWWHCYPGGGEWCFRLWDKGAFSFFSVKQRYKEFARRLLPFNR